MVYINYPLADLITLEKIHSDVKLLADEVKVKFNLKSHKVGEILDNKFDFDFMGYTGIKISGSLKITPEIPKLFLSHDLPEAIPFREKFTKAIEEIGQKLAKGEKIEFIK